MNLFFERELTLEHAAAAAGTQAGASDPRCRAVELCSLHASACITACGLRPCKLSEPTLVQPAAREGLGRCRLQRHVALAACRPPAVAAILVRLHAFRGELDHISAPLPTISSPIKRLLG